MSYRISDDYEFLDVRIVARPSNLVSCTRLTDEVANGRLIRVSQVLQIRRDDRFIFMRVVNVRSS